MSKNGHRSASRRKGRLGYPKQRKAARGRQKAEIRVFPPLPRPREGVVDYKSRAANDDTWEEEQ